MKNKKVMTVAAMQKRVKENISLLEDKTILEKINQLIDENSQVYILSEKQLELVQEAQEQYKKGDYISQDEMDKKVDLW